MQTAKLLFNQVGPLHQIAHEDEQRNRDQHIVAHHRKRALHHQIQRLLKGASRRLVARVIGKKGEQHAHTHQGKGRRKAQHDGHHHQREHQQTVVTVGHAVHTENHRQSSGDDQRHQHKAEAQFLANFHG